MCKEMAFILLSSQETGSSTSGPIPALRHAKVQNREKARSGNEALSELGPNADWRVSKTPPSEADVRVAWYSPTEFRM
jgi:hypothetical protein